MIESVLQYLNNWFAVARYDDTYTIRRQSHAAFPR